jgi:polysaccharide biosynthesis transport protein
MATTGNTTSISIFSVLDVLRRRKLFVIAPIVVLAAAFTIYAYTQPTRYRATASLAVAQTAPPEFLKHVASAPVNIQDHLWTVREILFSPRVLETAGKEIPDYRDVEGQLPRQVLESIKSNITVKIDSDRTFEITYDATDRFEAANIANKLAELFVEQASAKHEQKNEEAESVINNQIEALKKRLENQGKQLQDYKAQIAHALPDHIDDNLREAERLQTTYQDRSTKIAEEEAKRTSIHKQIQDLEAKGVLDQPNVFEKTAAETKLDELRIMESELETRYTPSHPDVIKVKRQIAELEKDIASHPKKGRNEPNATYLKYVELRSELEGIRQRVEAYKQDQKALSGQIASLSTRIEETPQHERVIDDMRREYDAGESQFHALLDKQLDAKLAEGLASSETGVVFAIVEPASVPTVPFSPQRTRLTLMGLAAGLGLGLVMAFVLEQNDTTFGTVDEFQAFTTLPVLGVIPGVSGTTKNKKKTKAASPIITISEPESVAAEQYRLCALRVRQQCEAAKSKVVMITSAAGAEGKSLTALNLAAALAPSVQGKVLVIDADMRKPRLNEYAGISVPPGKGFHDLLRNPDDGLEKYVQKTKGEMFVIPGAVPNSNAVAALSSPKTRAVFERLRQEFAMILIDAPPTVPIADSHILSGLSDKVVFVVRAKRTPRELFQHAVESFDTTNGLGAVLNGVD